MNKLLIAITILLLSACGQQKVDNVDSLWKHKTEYVGNNSKVINILSEAGAKDIGDYKIEIESDKKPYGLKVNYENVKDMDPEQLEKLAAVTMGLVGNLERMQINADGKDYDYTIDEINKKFNMDAKDLSKDKQKLKSFLEK
ncbi:DUF4825 domain-containing protein [Macrococcus epidermidis]|uniref:DUF4825 domain-containing protein n=1 Tax=Macrococcus epidermidis TaxID=1902580 RepID=UPI0020B6F08C|nr:DUF4825 domain-containing protein [Macrococcus epidermidis]UTH15857.1 DUF4825 domain-containing protein [Macrococcus epidermidis]